MAYKPIPPIDPNWRCKDCGFPITGGHCFEYKTPADIPVQRTEPVADQERLRRIRANDKIRKERWERAGGKSVKLKERREFFFVNGRKPIYVRAPDIRTAQEMAIEQYGPDIWPITDFD